MPQRFRCWSHTKNEDLCCAVSSVHIAIATILSASESYSNSTTADQLSVQGGVLCNWPCGPHTVQH